MPDFLIHNIVWILITVLLVCILTIIVIGAKIFKEEDLKKAPWDCLIAFILILVLVPFKYLIAAVCAGWIYVRLEMMRIEYQKKEGVEKIENPE